MVPFDLQLERYIVLKSFEDDLKLLSAPVRQQVYDCLREIASGELSDMRNPHLLIDEDHWGPTDVWSIYVDRTCYRITFRVKGRCAILRRVGKHDIYGDF